jgi:hypothetical protein
LAEVSEVSALWSLGSIHEHAAAKSQEPSKVRPHLLDCARPSCGGGGGGGGGQRYAPWALAARIQHSSAVQQPAGSRRPSEGARRPCPFDTGNMEELSREFLAHASVVQRWEATTDVGMPTAAAPDFAAQLRCLQQLGELLGGADRPAGGAAALELGGRALTAAIEQRRVLYSQSVELRLAAGGHAALAAVISDCALGVLGRLLGARWLAVVGDTAATSQPAVGAAPAHEDVAVVTQMLLAQFKSAAQPLWTPVMNKVCERCALAPALGGRLSACGCGALCGSLQHSNPCLLHV